MYIPYIQKFLLFVIIDCCRLSVNRAACPLWKIYTETAADLTAIDSFRQHEPHYPRLSPEIQSRAAFLLILAKIKIILDSFLHSTDNIKGK